MDRDFSAGDRADLLEARKRVAARKEDAVDQRQDAALDRVQSEADRADAGKDRAVARQARGGRPADGPE